MSTQLPVLLVDDDDRLLKAARRILHKKIKLHVAIGGKNALKMLEEKGPYAVVVSDQNMPEMQGTELLEIIAKKWPLTTRIMLTGNNDLETAVSAVNSGQIFRFLNKPCGPEDLLMAMEEGYKQYELIAGEKSLLEDTLFGSIKVLVDVLSASNPEAFQEANKVRELAKSLGQHMDLQHLWELDIAAMLWPLGKISLPDEVTKKIMRDVPLSGAEQALVDKIPQAGSDLIANIPRLENIAKAIYFSAKGFDGSGFPDQDVCGTDIPEQARVLRLLIDLVQQAKSQKCSLKSALATLHKSNKFYDPTFLKGLQEMLNNTKETVEKIDKTIEVSPNNLKVGDILAKDILSDDGRILLSAGHGISEFIITRLKNMDEVGLLPDPVCIRCTSENTPESATA